MTGRVVQANLLEPIEKASRDELTALQVERLKWTLHRVYDNVPPIAPSSKPPASIPTI